MDVSQTVANVRYTKRITIPPHSEMAVLGKLPKYIVYGYQGFCENNKHILSRGLIVCKAVVTVSNNITIPVKILNAGNNPFVIPKGKYLKIY